MKTALNYAVLIALAILATLAACTPKKPLDPCLNIQCQNGGNCNMEGKCECPTGFSGDSCEINVRDKAIGVFNTVSSSYDCNLNLYTVTIEASSLGINYVLVKNIDGKGTDLFGTVAFGQTGYGSYGVVITFPKQVAGSSSWDGSVGINENGLTGTYRIYRSSPYGSCEGTLTRKP